MENLNSVCYVARINTILPIEGADNIELATIGGWNCITKKGEYTPGDLVVIATTDAIIPDELANDMGIANYLRKGNRVRTVKLRGVYSECLIIPKRFLPIKSKVTTEGADIMQIAGITKYEPPVKMVQLASGRKIRYSENPNFPIYYKFPNIKNTPGIFNESDVVEITRKLHGTNARYGIVRKTKLSVWDKIKLFLSKSINPDWQWAAYEFVVGSHNVEKGSDSQGFYDTNVWYEIEQKYDIKDRMWNYVKSNLSEIGKGLVIYGEIYGPGIQKNYDYCLKNIEFAAFDVMMDDTYLNTMDTTDVLTDMELPYVPVLYVGMWSESIQKRFSTNQFIEGTKIPHEGIVVKAISGVRQKIAKVINPDYLIYGEKHDVGDSH